MTGSKAEPDAGDGHDLEQFGYKPQLARTLRSFSSFAAGFSYLSIMSGMFQLFAFGFGLAGSMMWWTWLVVFAGMSLVALCFAELSAKYPIAGSVYSWATREGSEAWGWMTGWLMLVASIVTLAGVAVAWQFSLPAISPFFQLVGDGTGPNDSAHNAVVLGTILLIAVTAANVMGVRLMARINNVGVLAEIVGVCLFIGLLLAHAQHNPLVVASSAGGPKLGQLGAAGAMLAAAIVPAWVMYGFDTAGALAEETQDPRRRAPRAILTALTAAGCAGMLLMLFAFMAAPSLNDPGIESGGLAFIVQQTMGPVLGKALLVFVVISTGAGGLAVQSATIRFMFAMARDRELPFSSWIGRVNPKTHTPINAALVVGAVVLAILFMTANTPAIFTVLTSIPIVMVYSAYGMTLSAQLRRRLAKRRGVTPTNAHFSLGRWGLLVNVVGLAFLVLGAVNFIWPREEIYGNGAYQFGGVVAVPAVIALGLLYRKFRRDDSRETSPREAATGHESAGASAPLLG